MIFDVLVLAAVCDELSRTIVNGKIERVTQPTPLEIVLRIYAGAGKQDLYISCDPASPRMHISSAKRENPPNPYAFCMLLRKHLDGGRVNGIRRPMGLFERVVAIECQSYDGAPFTLIVEIMGRHSNIILIDGPGTIRGTAKHITSDINRYREILPGVRYQNPPRQREKLDPLLPYQDDDGSELSAEAGAAWLLETFSGVSPLLARESTLRAAPRTKTQCWAALSGILGMAQRSEFSPVIWTDEHGITQGAYPIPLLSVESKYQYPQPSMNTAVDSAAASIDTRDAFQRLRGGLLVALQRSTRQKARELEEIQAGFKNSLRADEYQQAGDLIHVNQLSIERGATEAVVEDYYLTQPDGSPTIRTIALDPTLSARDNATRYYKKARKARESLTSLEQRSERIAEETAVLRLASDDVSRATRVEELESIHARVASLLIGKQSLDDAAESGHQEGPKFEGHKIRMFHSVDGWEILVGENATANDYLTTRLASPTDIWLHVRAATSAHGLIRSQNRPASVSPTALTYAAELVAARSEVKHSSLIPVDYTLKKYVRKPRKSAPGAVTYQNEKTVYVNGING